MTTAAQHDQTGHTPAVGAARRILISTVRVCFESYRVAIEVGAPAVRVLGVAVIAALVISFGTQPSNLTRAGLTHAFEIVTVLGAALALMQWLAGGMAIFLAEGRLAPESHDIAGMPPAVVGIIGWVIAPSAGYAIWKAVIEPVIALIVTALTPR